MKTQRTLLAALAASWLAACGGSSSSGSSGTSGSVSGPTGNVNLTISDAATEDWSLIGVKIESIALVPQGGGDAVKVFEAPTPAPVINLVQLDQLGEILGNLSVPVGTYTKAVLTLAANPGDVALTAASDPESGFAGTAGQSVDSGHVQIQGATGATGAKTVQVSVNLVTPLAVTASGSNALDLEFDLSHPAFLVAHYAQGDSTPIWAINFKGPVHHKPLKRLANLVMRHLYGQETSVSSDGASMVVEKEYPTYPATTPETATDSGKSLTVNADATNGTIVYDLDAKTRTVVKSFSSLASDASKYVRVATRYQDDGSLWAVRVWTSASFQKVWLSPEGHVLHVNTAGSALVVENEDAQPVTVAVGDSTQFFFRTPTKALADTTPIGTGAAFLANLKRGFKVHVSVVDPLAAKWVADTIDIEIARFDGAVSGVSTSGFTYTRQFVRASDDYTVTLPYLSSATANGEDASGDAVTGFKWWNLAFPTLADTGASAVADVVTATGGGVSFGGTAGALKVWGESYATWNDPANPNGWSAQFTVLVPQAAPLGTVGTAFSTSSSSAGSFGMTVASGSSTPLTVDLATAAGSTPLIYQVDRTGAIVTVNPEDISTQAGLAAVTAGVVPSNKVKVYGVPQADGTVKGYVLFYYTGTTPLR